MSLRHTKEVLEIAITNSNSWADVCRKIGIKPATGAQSHLKSKAVEYGLNFSHFLGQAWKRGKQSNARKDVNEYLHLNSKGKSHRIRLKLIQSGLKLAKCERCANVDWLGQPIPLELHHKNGEHTDNRLENLEILCPNCHALC